MKCEEENCTKIKIFGLLGEKPQFCKNHKTAKMTDLTHKMCEEDQCDSRPSFGIQGKKPQFCVKHKTSEMIDLVNKRCGFEGCKSINPKFGLKDNVIRFCKKHKTDQMNDVVSIRCLYDGCDLRPNYNILGKKGRYCLQHKTLEMVDVENKKCQQPGCTTQPIYGNKMGERMYCKKHKTDEMNDVINKRCESSGCDSQPSFDIPDGKGRFCVLHKLPDMIDVKHSMCKEENCKIRPNFGNNGERPLYCKLHKLSDMIEIGHLSCKYNECLGRAYYGKPSFQRSRCFQHREKGMIRRPNAKCSSCKDPAIWGINWIPRHCEKHKTEDDQNLVEKPCSSCGLLYVLDKNNKCEHCNPESFKAARLEKQKTLMAYLDAHDLKGSSTDKSIEDGLCGKERPDRVYDFGDKIIVLECDEHQHRDRQCLCEQTRMVNIGQSFGGLPVYFIRWNPDEYTPENEKKDPELLPKRYKLLSDLLRDIRDNKNEVPTALVSVLYLYYDGWSTLKEEHWKVLSALSI